MKNLEPNISITESELSEILSRALKEAKNGESQDLDTVFNDLLKDL